MNVMKLKLRATNAGCRLKSFPRSASRPFIAAAFTLIELLVVIVIIGVLAAFLIPVIGVVSRLKYTNAAKAEMNQLETAIDTYKNDRGYYPPGNGDGTNGVANQLYYELEGTTLTNINGKLTYVTLDGATSILSSDVPVAFPNAGGFANCNKQGAGDEVRSAKDYIHELKPHQIETAKLHDVQVTIFTSIFGGPDGDYNPLNQPGVNAPNPWRYVSSNPKHNHDGYDLWIQLKINGKTYLIDNWNSKVTVNDTSAP